MIFGALSTLLAALLSVLAGRLAAGAPGAASGFYGLEKHTHRRFCLVFGALAAGSALAVTRFPALVYPLLAVLVLLGVFYGSSFARGAHDESEL